MPGIAPPPHELVGMSTVPPMEGIHPPFGFLPRGLLSHPPGLLPPSGGPMLLTPGISNPGTPMVLGPPPEFPDFASRQPPPRVRMQGPGHIPVVLAAPQGMPGGPPGLLQSPRPPLAGPPGLLGPPPGALVPVGGASVGQGQGQGSMDLEEQDGREFEERRESEVETNIGGIETGGLVEDGKTRNDRRDRGDRGRYGLCLH